MLSRSIRSRATLVAIVLGTPLLTAECSLAGKVEMRKLPSYSAFEGFVLPADAPEDPAWLIPAYERESWHADAGQEDWDRLYAIEWSSVDGKSITREPGFWRFCGARLALERGAPDADVIQRN